MKNKFNYLIHHLFGEIDNSIFADTIINLLFFISLFSATCFFFDAHVISFFGYNIHFPVGLIFFPATFVLSNIIQDRKGRKSANTIVACCFLADLTLVLMSWLIANIGDRDDFYTVFNEVPIIMGATFIFITVSSIFNTYLFDRLSNFRAKGALGLFILFFVTTTAAELLVSSMSMPLLFYRRGFNGGVYLSILVTVSYKVIFNLISSLVYVYVDSVKKDAKISQHSDLAKVT